MIIDLGSVGAEARMIKRTIEADEIDLTNEDIELTGPIELVAEIGKQATKTKLTGTIGTSISRDCTRCLEPVTGDLAFEFETSFVDAENGDSRADAEVSIEDLDISLVEDGKIDLADVVREQILLALPIQIFCKDDCKGMCPKCGGNLNLIDCKCSDDEIDPRWAALKGLK
ncbi:DUF177 domain-containing protein [soil metagenome]